MRRRSWRFFYNMVTDHIEEAGSGNSKRPALKPVITVSV
jgi:hypothetical protein